ncbi:MAG: sporulation protein [Polyangiaceae bacterium]|nr:sporulation protein [Polyangiaceae bacterium]
MGFFDKVKGAIHAVTGGAANVQFTYGPHLLFPGQQVQIGINATSTGGQVSSKGVFIDLSANEVIDFKDGSDNHIRYQEQTFYKEIQVAPAFTLAPNETKQFEVTLLVPADARPSFVGKLCKHQWQMRARIEAFGNDPDTGWIDTRVGLKD